MTLQHYMDYTAESLIPVMAHIAKNVVKVNEGLTKHMVSAGKPFFFFFFSFLDLYPTLYSKSVKFLFLTLNFFSYRLLKASTQLQSR